jgi:hypothetical protein
MNAVSFDRDLDVTLGRAADSLALAREIENALELVAAGVAPECRWRRYAA